MKHIFKYLMIIFIFASFTASQSIAQKNTFAFKLNGHKHNQSEDLMMRRVQEVFFTALDSLEIPALLDSLATENSLEIDELNMPSNIHLEYQVDSSKTSDFLAKVTIDTLSFTASGLSDCVFEVNIIDAGFILGGVSTYEKGQLKIELGEPDILQSEILVVASGEYLLCPVLAELFKSGMESQIDTLILDLASMFNSESLVGSLSILNPIHALGIEDSVLIEQALNSFPMQMDLYTEEDTQQEIIQLIVEINFLMGTREDPAAFLQTEPSNVSGSQLYNGGFSFLYWVLQRSFPWHDWSEAQRIAEALQLVGENGFKDYRIELRWNDLQKIAYMGNDLDPDQISLENIGDFLSDEEHWDTTAISNMKSYLEGGFTSNLNPFMAIGVGHQDRMPLSDDGMSLIAPGTEEWESPDGYIRVSANEYLYNLKIYAHAVVRKLADDIDIWQIENELNAAGFAASLPQWWRKGNLWIDAEFRNQVWKILVDAVHSEDPDAQIIHDLHMLGFMDGMEEWLEDMDIVGINYYPNQVNSLPLMGFSVGEYVWAVRRALKGLGFENKEVWLTETGYPGIEIIDPPENIHLADDIVYFSENRQSMYIEDAITSAVENGANGFFYYSLVTQEDFPEEIWEPMRYSGMVRRDSDVHKKALNTFAELFGQYLVTKPTAIEGVPESIPFKLSLDQNYPNPFNPTTIIDYELPITNYVDLSIYNILGEKVVTLVSGRQQAGYYNVDWDASAFPSGIYICRITAGTFNDSIKMILLK